MADQIGDLGRLDQAPIGQGCQKRLAFGRWHPGQCRCFEHRCFGGPRAYRHHIKWAVCGLGGKLACQMGYGGLAHPVGKVERGKAGNAAADRGNVDDPAWHRAGRLGLQERAAHPQCPRSIDA